MHIIPVSPCTSIACQNEGSCRVNNGMGSCFCKGDFTGANCESKFLLEEIVIKKSLKIPKV